MSEYFSLHLHVVGDRLNRDRGRSRLFSSADEKQHAYEVEFMAVEL